jgi:hypothetical protein
MFVVGACVALPMLGPPAGASNSARSARIAGTWEWNVNYDGRPNTWAAFDISLYTDHTGSDFYGDTITWARSGMKITVRRVSTSGAKVVYRGRIGAGAFCSYATPCPMKGGLWYARRIQQT